MQNPLPARLLPIVLIAAAVLSGCQSRPDIEIDPSLNAENAATIYIYRPSSQRMGGLVDYRITMDGRYIGSLKKGRHIQVYAKPGDRGITVQPHLFSKPNGMPWTVGVRAEAGESYYVRFSHVIDNVLTYGAAAGTVIAHVELHEVSAEMWEQRR